MKDDLGDRIKKYEALTELQLMPALPTFARMDGRAFHSFTRGMKRPYDDRLITAMVNTAIFLAKKTNALLAYTQSDEITLLWRSTDPLGEIFFNYRHSKMVSNLASMTSVCFYRQCLDLMPEYVDRIPTFDARVWQVPNDEEAINVLKWREMDAVRNSINMLARSVYSHKDLLNTPIKVIHELLHHKGLNWNNFPSAFKRGTYVQRKAILRKFDKSELIGLPDNHEAVLNPDLEIIRHTYVEVELPPLSKIPNLFDVIFNGGIPNEIDV